MIGRVFRSRSRSPSPFSRRKQYGSGNLLPRKRWGRRLNRGFRDGAFFLNRRSKYAYPLWYYYGNYYPWWYAYHVGFMDTLLYNKYVSKYGAPPPDYNGPTYPSALNRSYALPIPMGDEISDSISCDVCGSTQEETQLHHCEGCREAIYCGVECQRVDFENHKNDCI
jgi:MYND finger